MASDLKTAQSPPSADSAATRTFDFLVVGAARSGTTSLWRGLDSHPQIRMPSDKERQFFGSAERYRRGLQPFIERTYAGATEDQVLGVVTPQLMHPHPRALNTLVDRIEATCPDAKIIALLRDPVERAVSQFRRMKKMGQGKEETFDGYVRRMVKKRGKLNRVPLVMAGDYGRILQPYFDRFGPDQVKVFFTADLDRDPTTVYRQIFELVGVDTAYSPAPPRIHVGGTKQLVTTAALEEMAAELDRLGVFNADNADVRRGFVWWLRHIWNAEPDEEGKEMGPKLRRALSRRYLADTEKLIGLGVDSPPWVDDLRKAAA